MSFPGDANASQMLLGGGARDAIPPIGAINFVAQGTDDPAKFCVVPKEFNAGVFVEQFFRNGCNLERPKVLISVTGGAQDFNMLSSKLEQIFSRGLLRAAQNTTAWIVTGGLDTGVMKFVGDAIREQETNIPCIGIATYSRVSHKEQLTSGVTVSYAAEKPNDALSAALNPNHSHFVLVDSKVDNWGEEITFRNELENYISTVWEVPMVLVAVNGGSGTVQTVLEGARKKFPIVIVDSSGRASDSIASYFKSRLDPSRYKNRMNEWQTILGLKPADIDMYTKQMQELFEARQYITIFNPNENATEDMDKAILRSVLRIHANSGFAQKLSLGVQWGRADLIEELLQTDDTTLAATDKVNALNRALQKSLKLNKPEIYELLVSKGADKTTINLYKLYNQKDLQYQIQRLVPFAGLIGHKDNKIVPLQKNENGETTPLIKSPGGHTHSHIIDKSGLETAKKILDSISPMYATLLVDNKVTFTDVLVWAILVERHDLAKAIWRQTTLPVHSALVACHLFSVLGEWFSGEEEYNKCKDWFEQEAIKVLSEVEYEVAVDILEWKWMELNATDALELSELADCKDFFSQSYVQRYLDEKFYSDEFGAIPPGTKMWRIIIMVLFPFLISSTGSYIPNNPDGGLVTPFYYFYTLPVAKFISSTISYTGFLILLTANVLLIQPDVSVAERFDIYWYEYLLWIWIFASLAEEVAQFFEDPKEYFSLLSNRMDMAMYALLVIYVVLRILAWALRSDTLLIFYSDVLIVSTIACYLRVMNVFAFSKSLGPLFFVIIRLFQDVWQWLFIFLLFMISFQAGIFALTRQSGNPAWAPYPGGSMGSAFTAILGDLGDDTMEWMTHTNIGVILILGYSLITQVMLVNLLIAMMGDTYSSVKENSDKEWKFYRYSLVVDYVTSSAYPPPFNLIFGPLFYIKRKIDQNSTKARLEYINLKAVPGVSTSTIINADEMQDIKTLLKMKKAKERVLDQEGAEDLDTLHTVSLVVREHMRILNTQRDSDRLYIEQNMSSILSTLATLQQQIEQINNRMGAPQTTPSTTN